MKSGKCSEIEKCLISPNIENIEWKFSDEDSVLILIIDEGLFMECNSTGSFIWSEIIKWNVSFKDIVNGVCKNFDIKENIAEKDAKDFLDVLVEKKAIVLTTEKIEKKEYEELF